MKKILLAFLVIFIANVFADEQNVVSKIFININGNENTLPDEISRELSNFYLDTKDDMAAEQIGKKFDGQYVRRIDLGDDVDKFIYKRIDDETIKIILRIDFS